MVVGVVDVVVSVLELIYYVLVVENVLLLLVMVMMVTVVSRYRYYIYPYRRRHHHQYSKPLDVLLPLPPQLDYY